MINAGIQTLNTWGPLIGLTISIVLIIFKLHPVYSLIAGALIGGFLGCINMGITDPFTNVINCMIDGSKNMISAVLRIIASGILAGALIMTGSAEKIASSIVKLLGNRFSLIAIAISTMIICMVGVFIDISVITVAPIAISVAKKANISKAPILLAMIGGGKAGNIISPNPNTIATSEAYGIDLSSLIIRNIVPAIFALLATIGICMLMSYLLKKKGVNPENEYESDKNEEEKKETLTDENGVEIKREEKKGPNIFQALAGPLVVIILLILRPTANVNIDPLIALPIGGLVCILATLQYKKTLEICDFGLKKVVGIAVLLIGTGTISGIISHSNINVDITNLLNAMKLPAFLLAPISGFLMAAATASTTSGATIASNAFAKTITEAGVSATGAAAMTHASATILDSLPHGSFFHATGGSVSMDFKNRLKLVPFEALIGLVSTIVSIIAYLIVK